MIKHNINMQKNRYFEWIQKFNHMIQYMNYIQHTKRIKEKKGKGKDDHRAIDILLHTSLKSF